MKTRLTSNSAPEGGLLWAPDGSLLLFTAADDRTWLNRNPKIYVMDPNAKTHRLVSGEYEGGIGDIVWTPDGRAVLFSGQQGVDTHLFRLDIQTGRFEQLTKTPGTFGGASFSRDRTKVAWAFSDFDTPADVWASDVNEWGPVRLTDANPDFAKKFALASMKVVQWKSRGNMEIEGLLHLPASYVTGTRVPLMLNIHGGPAGSWRNSFSPMYHVYGGLGYASLSPNVRGSSGYGRQFRYANRKDWGGGDYQDILSGVDALVARGVADPDRLGVMGWSYGGYMTSWIVTQTQRFKAADWEEIIEPLAGNEGHTDELANRDLLYRAFAKLTPRQRAVVELTYYFGYSYEEIARIIGCPENTVKTRMFHARAKLKECLQRLGQRNADD